MNCVARQTCSNAYSPSFFSHVDLRQQHHSLMWSRQGRSRPCVWTVFGRTSFTDRWNLFLFFFVTVPSSFLFKVLLIRIPIYLASHAWIILSHLYIYFIVTCHWIDTPVLYMRQSFAVRHTVVYVDTCRLLINNKNSKRPNIVPWGTPETTSLHLKIHHWW